MSDVSNQHPASNTQHPDMSEESTQPTRVNLIRMDDGRWRVFVDDEDMGTAFQFPWDALQCALNGSLTGKPITNLQAIEINATASVDQQRLARARAAQVEQRALLAALRGIDGEGI
jgi:hypothetical protein